MNLTEPMNLTKPDRNWQNHRTCIEPDRTIELDRTWPNLSEPDRAWPNLTEPDQTSEPDDQTNESERTCGSA